MSEAIELQAEHASALIDLERGGRLASLRTGADRVLGPRWTEHLWTADTSGPVSVTLAWAGSANLRTDARTQARVWLAADTSTAQPKSISFTATAGSVYRLAVWSMAGSADYSFSIEPG